MPGVLFPEWSSPMALLAVLGLRTVLNVGLVVLTLRATRGRILFPAAAAALAIAIGTAAFLALQFPGVGQPLSYLDLGGQLALLVLTAAVISMNGARGQWLSFAAVAVTAVLCLLLMIPIYGEAFVAP